MLNDEERKQYNIQKNKYEGHLRILKKQEVSHKDKPVTLEEARSLKKETYYENDDDDCLDENDHTHKDT